MGQQRANSLPVVSQEEEIADLAADADSNGMRMLSKTMM